jgi:uncharacterized protein
VPLSHGRALFASAPEPKHMHVLPGRGHNDLVPLAGTEFVRVIASWVSERTCADNHPVTTQAAS